MPISDKIDLYIQELQSLIPMRAEDKQRLDKKFRLEFNYNSNHMEGNTLTYNETELLLLFDDVKGNHTLRELEEMKAHDVAYKFIEELAADKERPLTEQVIKNLNEIILVRTFWKDAQTQDGQSTRRQIKIGDYKEFSNSVRLQNGEMFHYASPTDTPIKMAELLEWYRTEETNLYPLTLAAMLHYKFVRIHPFDDGNGRISRLLMNYVLLKHNLPPVVIKSKEKSDYLSALHLADVGDYEAFISYIGEQLEWSLNLSIKAAKGESIEESGDLEKEIELLKTKLSGKNRSKSPKSTYEVFEYSKLKMWPSLLSLLKEFNDFFNDSNTEHFVNGNTEVFGTHNILNPFEKSNKPHELKIFGHEIYNEDIQKIEWHHSKFGLKGALKNSKFEINFSLNFEKTNYKIIVSLNYKVIYSKLFLYNELPLQAEIDELKNVLGKALITSIDENS